MRRAFFAALLLACRASSASAQISATNILAGGNGTPATSFVTGSVSPTANLLNVLAVYDSGTPAPLPTVTGASMTWTQIGTCAIDGANVRRVTAFRALSASPGSGALTIDFAGSTATVGAWVVDQFTGMNTSGTNGSGAIAANSGSITSNACTLANGTNTTNSITLSALSNASNATWGYVKNNGVGAVTVGSGYTVLGNNSTNGRNVSEYESPGSTTVNFTWGSQTNQSVIMALEIAIPASSTTSNNMMLRGVK